MEVVEALAVEQELSSMKGYNMSTENTEESVVEVAAIEEQAVEVEAPSVEAVEAVEVVEAVDVVAEETAPVEEAPAPNSVQRRKPARDAVTVSGMPKDDVLLSKCVFKNVYARKSLTIHHVQRRLEELGYREAGSDKDGWYGDKTKLAVAEFQKDNKLGDSGVIDAATLEAIFADDPYVNVIID